MNTRRKFLKIVSLLGLTAVMHNSLFAFSKNSHNLESEAVGVIVSDHSFDPDGWL